MQRPGERAAVGRDEADGHVRVRQVRRLRHVHHVGERDHTAAEPDGRTVDRGDHGDPTPDHVEHELAALGDHARAEREVVRHPVEEIEVATGRERASFPGDHRDARIGVGTELGEQPGEREVQVLVDRVELLGSRQADDAHRTVGLDADHVREVVVHAARPPLGTARPALERPCDIGWLTGPADLRRAVHSGSPLGQLVGRPRMRVAMMFFWICDVPPITLWARL